jgi:hypothetical protein
MMWERKAKYEHTPNVPAVTALHQEKVLWLTRTVHLVAKNQCPNQPAA